MGRVAEAAEMAAVGVVRALVVVVVVAGAVHGAWCLGREAHHTQTTKRIPTYKHAPISGIVPPCPL